MIDDTLFLRLPPHQGQVVFLYRPIFEAGPHLPRSARIERKEDYTAGASVEAMKGMHNVYAEHLLHQIY